MTTRVKPGAPSSARPSGTVTFLFSDIEGSTERWEQDRDAMADALARHDALMRTALEARSGYIFKTIGDEFCAAFASVADAVAAALDAQRALFAEDFSGVAGMRVRMALHRGHAHERDGDYFGPPVNRVARLLAIGHGGQVLLSEAAAEELDCDMPAQCALRDLGAHRLKDLAHPERVYQLVAPGLSNAFPALRSLAHLSNNLPAQLTTFVGREQVAIEIKALIAEHRLVTLTGSGGAGKTRCAIQLGAELIDEFSDGVWLAELASIADAELVPNVIAQALSAQGSPHHPTLDTVLAYLKRKRLLLVLDNCEHVIDQARRVAGAILRDCPRVRIIATSREPLNIAGEQIYRVPSLAFPSNAATLFREGASRYGSVQLFLDRARSSEMRFDFTESNASYVAEICRRLDGIPLAIELAAARVKILSPKQLAEKLDERFRVLTGGDRTALPRHQTMRALIDWSYDLLSEEERALFRTLSIFAGGFTFEAAAAVCGVDGSDDIAVLDRLTSVVDKSLVQADVSPEGTRYRMLESTRQYARERLIEQGEFSAVALAHARAFLALAEKLDRLYDTTEDRKWRAQAGPEMDNCRAALEWVLTGDADVALGQRLAANMRWMFVHFAATEGRRWIRTALAATGPAIPDDVIGKLELADAQIDIVFMQHKASYEAAARAAEKLQRANDPAMVEAQRTAARGLMFLGSVAESEARLRQALVSAERFGLRKLKAAIFADLAILRQNVGDLDEARALFTQARELARAINPQSGMAFVTTNLAELEYRAGNMRVAVALSSEALAESRARGNTREMWFELFNLSAYLIALGEYGDARDYACEALRIARELEAGVLAALSLQHLAAVALFRDERYNDAAYLLGYIDARVAALEGVREYTEEQEYEKIVSTLRAHFGEEPLAKLMAEGSNWTEERAVSEATSVFK